MGVIKETEDGTWVKEEEKEVDYNAQVEAWGRALIGELGPNVDSSTRPIVMFVVPTNPSTLIQDLLRQLGDKPIDN